LKLWVIVATDGRVVATGAAGAFFDLGFYSLLVGSTGLGVRLTRNQEPALRGVAAVGSPIIFVLAFALFSAVGSAILAVGGVLVGVSPPGYLFGEAGIFISAVVWLAIGLVLLFGLVREPRKAVLPQAERPPREGLNT
jgi:O-antigen ligase